jgi:hypothetical protein
MSDVENSGEKPRPFVLRARTIATQDRTREVHRLEKFLESTGIKLSDSVSDLMGASSRAMLDALIDGGRDQQKVAELADQT